MPRYFIEVAYNGTNYAGFQIQNNALTIQAVLENALQVYFKEPWVLTGSSRTDAGVHALQNFYHVDVALETIAPKAIYNLNAILPKDVVLKNITKVLNTAHCRFDATSRNYTYKIHQNKNPFVENSSYYFPYNLQFETLENAAKILMQYNNFESFSKKHAQVNNYICTIITSQWQQNNEQLIYNVSANRFLRGMVRALVATMLQVGTGRLSLEKFECLLQNPKIASAYFNAPAHGLFLAGVNYP
jgi:tRNA pseudouridine38-40 synthase